MIQELFGCVMQHPFWALYIAVLLGVAIHGFRPKSETNNIYYENEED